MSIPSVRDSINKAREELEADVSVADTVAADTSADVAAASTEVATADEGDSSNADQGRTRGPDGKFAAKAAADLNTPAAAAVTTTEKIPKNWETGDRRKVWDAIAPEHRKHILEREEGVEKFVTTATEERAFGKTMRDAIAPFEQMIRSEGSDPVTAVSHLMQTAAFLRQGSPEQKRQLILKLAQDYGVNLGQIPAQAASVQPHPEVEQLRTGMQTLTQWAQQQEQQRIQTELAHAQSAIDDFTKTHPLFEKEEIRSQAGLLLKNGLCANLEEAYEKAVWADPTTRSQMILQESEKAKADRIADANRKKSAAVTVTGSPNGSRTTVFEAKPGESVRESINRARQALSASA